MFSAFAWKIRPSVWFKLPKWERAAMVAAVVGRSLTEAAAAKVAENARQS